jgi:hypothetical protein
MGTTQPLSMGSCNYYYNYIFILAHGKFISFPYILYPLKSVETVKKRVFQAVFTIYLEVSATFEIYSDIFTCCFACVRCRFLTQSGETETEKRILRNGD